MMRAAMAALLPALAAVPAAAFSMALWGSALRPKGFWNRPGGTRQAFAEDWTRCQQISRETAGETGPVPGLAGFLLGELVEGKPRTTMRDLCLQVRGWRRVEPVPEMVAQVKTLPAAEIDQWIDARIGASDLPGMAVFAFANPFAEPRLKGGTSAGAAPVPSAPLLAEPDRGLALAPGDAAVLVGFYRPDRASAGTSAQVSLFQFNAATGALAHRDGELPVRARSHDRKAVLEYRLVRLRPGDYAFGGAELGPFGQPFNSFCLAAPLVRVAPGEIAYIGTFTPYSMKRMEHGRLADALAFHWRPEEARAALAGHPELILHLSTRLPENGASFPCRARPVAAYAIPASVTAPVTSAPSGPN